MYLAIAQFMKLVQRALSEEEGCSLEVLKWRHSFSLLKPWPCEPCHLWGSSAGAGETPAWGNLAVCIWGRLAMSGGRL